MLTKSSRSNSSHNPTISIAINHSLTMKFSLAVLLASVGAAGAFAPASTTTGSNTLLRSTAEPVMDNTPPPPAPINGWVPDKSKPCYGLPGAISPLGYFDPLGFCNERDLVGVKRFREAEIMHGRVAMMATVGY